MTSIISYQKVTDEFTTHRLREPDYADDDDRCTELCTIAGITYEAVPDSVTLPDQPAEITVEAVTMTDELRAEIKAASRHVELINERIQEGVREKYSQSDETKMLRIGSGPEYDDWIAHVEMCVAEGRAKKTALGLG